MLQQSPYRVRAVHCDNRAGDEEVYLALKRATDPLTAAWAKLKKARRITIKFNQGWPPDKLVRYEGMLQELVDYKIARATLRLLRENTTAELVCCEIPTGLQDENGFSPLNMVPLLSILQEYGVAYADGGGPPHKIAQVPGGGLMFRQYMLPAAVVDTDAFVSVQKMKSHAFMGVTLCLKNLFGLPPTPPLGRGRQYFHHIIRLSYVLGDLGLITQPTLNIIDALVGQSKREWGGEVRVCNTLVAGDHVIATDACGTHLMGHDPQSDWPTQPFLRDRNAILVAAENGFGTVKLSEIDYESEVSAPVAQFSVEATDPFKTVAAWRRSTCEQALYYRDNAKKFYDQYAGEYILLQDNEVRWHEKQSEISRSRRQIAGGHKDSALWFKLVDPEEAEGEHFEVYERTLARLQEMGL
jgi:hypothetical protein